MLQASMTPKEKQYYSEILYIDYMSSEESDYEEQEDFITGEKEKKLARYVTKKLSWERTSLTNAKARLDRTYKNNLTPMPGQWLSQGVLVACRRGLHLLAHFGLSGR